MPATAQLKSNTYLHTCLLQGVDMSEDEVATVMATIDEDGGGDIDLGEFTNWFLGLDTKQEGEKISKIGEQLLSLHSCSSRVLELYA